MNQEEIAQLFYQAIDDKKLRKKSGYPKHRIYDLAHSGRTEVTIERMLGYLYAVGVITVSKSVNPTEESGKQEGNP